jgi:sporulation protein YlmC with PRC-barrel domain
MAAQEVHIELLLNRRVVAANGRAIGRIEEVCAELRAGEAYVTEYLVGAFALFERLAAWRIGRELLTLFGARRRGHGYRVPWDKLDLSDPERPRLICKVEELAQIKDEGQT